MKIFSVMQKNIKVLFRSRFTSLMILFGPLIVILLIGYAFNDFGNYKIQVGTFCNSYSDISQSYIDELSKGNFKMLRYSSELECIEDIKYGAVHTCLVFSDNFSMLDSENKMKFYVDPSNINLVWMVIDEVSKKIESSSSKISFNMTSDLLGRVEKTKINLNDITSMLNNLSKSSQDIQVITYSVDKNIDKISFEDKVPDIISLNVRDLDQSILNLYTHSINSVDLIDNLINEIRNSSTWSKLNSSVKTYLGDKFNSAKISASSIRTSFDSDFNLTTNEMSDLLTDIIEMDDTLNSIEKDISDAKLASSEMYEQMNDIRAALDNLKSYANEINSKISENIMLLSGMSTTDAKDIVNPISTEIIHVTESTQKHVNYLFPSLLILIIMFISLLLSSLSIVLEKNSRAYFRNFVTPTNDMTFFAASYLTNILVIIFQLIIVFGVTYFLIDTSIVDNLFPSITILLLSSTFFVLLGMIIGYMFSSPEGAILGSISISSIFFFVSNLIMPIDVLPETVKFIVELNPFIITSGLLKRSFLFNVSFKILQHDLITLLIYIAVAMLFLIIIQRITKLKFFYHSAQKNKKVELTTKPVQLKK